MCTPCTPLPAYGPGQNAKHATEIDPVNFYMMGIVPRSADSTCLTSKSDALATGLRTTQVQCMHWTMIIVMR